MCYNADMQYTIELKPRAEKDLKKLDRNTAHQIITALEKLQDNFAGDVKRLTNFTPEYRLRSGNYRILFELESVNRVVVYRIRHRREAYR